MRECPQCWTHNAIRRSSQIVQCGECGYSVRTRDFEWSAEAWNDESRAVSEIFRELCQCGRVARIIRPHGSTIRQPGVGCFTCSLICYGPSVREAIEYWNQHRRTDFERFADVETSSKRNVERARTLFMVKNLLEMDFE